MGARQKLNIAYLDGSILLAALAGWLTQSWPVFLLTLAALLGLNLYRHQIRPQKPRKHEEN